MNEIRPYLITENISEGLSILSFDDTSIILDNGSIYSIIDIYISDPNIDIQQLYDNLVSSDDIYIKKDDMTIRFDDYVFDNVSIIYKKRKICQITFYSK